VRAWLDVSGVVKPNRTTGACAAHAGFFTPAVQSAFATPASATLSTAARIPNPRLMHMFLMLNQAPALSAHAQAAAGAS
jgi:hypothetical protein